MPSVIAIATKALQEAIKSVVDALTLKVGTDDDGASASGSLHAKAKEELARIGSGNPASAGTDTIFKYLKKLYDTDMKLKDSEPKIVNVNNIHYMPPNWSTIVNETGKSGFLTGIVMSIMGVGSPTYAAGVELTIDDSAQPITFSLQRYAAPEGAATDGSLIKSIPFMHRFNDSLKVKAYGDGNNNFIITYILDA